VSIFKGTADPPRLRVVVSAKGALVLPGGLCDRCKMEEATSWASAPGRLPMRVKLGEACIREWNQLHDQFKRGWRPGGDFDPFRSIFNQGGFQFIYDWMNQGGSSGSTKPKW